MFSNQYPQPWVFRFKSDSEMISYCENKNDKHQCLYKDCTNGIDSDEKTMCKTHDQISTEIVNLIVNFLRCNFETWLVDWSLEVEVSKDKALYPTRICKDISTENILEYAGDNDLLFQYFILKYGDYALEDPHQFAYECITFETVDGASCIYEILDRPVSLDISDNNSYIKFLIIAMLHRNAVKKLTLDFDKPDKPERVMKRLLKIYKEKDDEDWISPDDNY
ncbi:MAG: hypothetical protein WD512_20830 [Candidatus Paceibacterota bacterium]